MSPAAKAAKIASDECYRLYRAVERYVVSRGGSVLVAGGIQVQQWHGEPKCNFILAIKCTGKRPAFAEEVIANKNERSRKRAGRKSAAIRRAAVNDTGGFSKGKS